MQEAGWKGVLNAHQQDVRSQKGQKVRFFCSQTFFLFSFLSSNHLPVTLGALAIGTKILFITLDDIQTHLNPHFCHQGMLLPNIYIYGNISVLQLNILTTADLILNNCHCSYKTHAITVLNLFFSCLKYNINAAMLVSRDQPQTSVTFSRRDM